MPIQRINVAQYDKLGEKFIEWITKPETRPKTLAELKTQLAGIATLPDYITDFKIEQEKMDTLFVRLPPKELVDDTLTALKQEKGRYPLPPGLQNFYTDLLAERATGREAFKFRVGDYIIAHCT